MKDNLSITLTDIRKNYCTDLNQKFSGMPSLSGVKQLNLTDPDFRSKHADLHETFDTVFALNVVEHIKDDNLAISNARDMLKPGGHLIILVPAYDALYNKFDYELGHYRRYAKSSLSQLFRKNNFKVIHQQYFNFAGIMGWFVSGSILKNKIIPAAQVNLFNRLVPAFKIIDRILLNQVGLSTIAVGRK
jgi:2-polyprenyl-3-methyl-5-hydroxy-6-metoxy-1,4-benzoquinol methylase